MNIYIKVEVRKEPQYSKVYLLIEKTIVFYILEATIYI